MYLVYHHNDMDGICAAAIVHRHHVYNFKSVPVQYNKDTWNEEDVKEADYVYVLDFTFPDMEKLAEIAGDKLVWCDHHKTAMEQHLELWNSEIEGLRSLDSAGCTLTWNYCFMGVELPKAVQYIADRDMWKFEYEETKAFCMAANILINDPSDDRWNHILLIRDTEETEDMIEFGNFLLNSQEHRVKKLFENGTDITFHGHRARLCNTTSDFSELGEYIYSQPEYDIAVMWQIINGKIIFSLRSNTVDCAAIAQTYSGGGHKGAAGFSLDNMFEYPKRFLSQ